MEDSEKSGDAPGDAPSPRRTLKLKARIARPAAPPAPAPRPMAPRHHEPANWADEHKNRMQADMDALSAGFAPPNRPRRR